MKRLGVFLILSACPVMAYGQGNAETTGNSPGGSALQQRNQQPNNQRQRLEPIVPPPSTTVYGGGGFGYGQAQTAEGAALQGMSQVISAQGQYNLATSAAAINLTEAQSNELHNQVQGVQTFWQMRDIGRAEREKERGPRLTPEQIARIAHDGAPRSLSASQMDPVSGVLFWPSVLQDPSFETQRTALDELTARWVKYGTLEYPDQTQIRDNVNSLFDTLKSRIASIPPQDYVASRSFLQSLLYATTRTTF